ncbi:MAG: hypothetical protein Q9195_004607 [Heterodermia aff. obscurata]
MSALVNQELIVSSKAHVSDLWLKSSSCGRVWNVQEAKFQEWFLPIIAQLPHLRFDNPFYKVIDKKAALVAA